MFRLITKDMNWSQVSSLPAPQLYTHEWTAASSKREEAGLVREQTAVDIDWQGSTANQKRSLECRSQLDLVI